jgi:hypothetical protein
MTEGYEEDQDSLFGSPPPSRISSPASASICDTERRLSTSTDTQNVGTIALPGSHPFSELPMNPLALSLNRTTVHRPPAGQPVPITVNQQSQPWQPVPAQNKSKGSKKSRQSSQSPVSSVPPCDPEFSFPDPSAPPPVHFLRNQQNLLGKAGLVAGVKPSTITHIRGTTSSNPIVIDDEDTPLLGRQSQSRETRHRYINPALLKAPTNEDIVSVLIGQKDIFPVLKSILDPIGKDPTRRTPATSLQSRHNSFKHPPNKKRKLDRVPAGAADWDVPYPFQEGEGPDEYRKTWERERQKHLVVQLVKLVKMAARKAATKNYLQKEQARQAAWKKLQEEMMESKPIIKKDMTVNNHYKPQTLTYGLSSDDQSLFNTWMTFLQAFPVAFDAQSQSQSSLPSSQASTPGLDDFASINTMTNDFDFGTNTEESPWPISNTPAVQDDLDALISSMLDSLSQDMESTPVPTSSSSSAWEPDIFVGNGGQGVFRHTLWDNFSQAAYRGSIEGGGWDEVDQITQGSLAEEGDVIPMVGGKGKEVLRTNPLSADATTPTQSVYNTSMGTQSTLSIYDQQVHPTTIPELPRPRNTIAQSRKEEILRRAREKKKDVQQQLDGVKTQLWETTIEQAALVHLLKRFENDHDQ